VQRIGVGRDDHKVKREVVEVELEGGAIRLPGWTFCGTIEHLGDENVLRAVPGQTIPDQYRDAAKQCDHCGLDRQRIDTFVVVSDAGEYRQVGRSCTADYLGSVDPQRLASWLEAVHAAVSSDGGEDDGMDWGSRAHPSYRPDEIVAIANGAIRAFGYHKADSDRPTKRTVETWMHGTHKERDSLERAGMDVTADDYAEAEAMVAWAAEQGRDNDYIANLAAYARQERVDGRAMGLLASLPTAYARAMGRIAEQKARDEKRAVERENATPAPTGKVTVEGTITGEKWVETDFGTTHKVAILTAEGWRLWVTLPAAISSAQIGDTVRLTATVTPSSDDPTFAFGQRPSKASIIAEAAQQAALAVDPEAPVDQDSVCPESAGRPHWWIEIEGRALCGKCGAHPHHLSEAKWDYARQNGEIARQAGWTPPALRPAAACA